MAQRWSLGEDFIIAKFCQEQQYLDICDNLLDELIDRLRQKGFSSRSKSAISKRARDFTYLFRGWEPEYVAKQVKQIYGLLSNEGYNNHLKELKERITERQQASIEGTSGNLDFLNSPADQNIHMIHRIQGRKFVDVLEDYIANSGIKPRSRMYRDVGMSEDTFSAIRRGKYKAVSRENLFRICFGLRLKYDDAVILMKSCGCALQDSNVLDCVVEYFLRKGPTVDCVYKDKGKEKICYIYDTFQIDADLIESGASELFWGFRKGDDKDDEDEQ